MLIVGLGNLGTKYSKTRHNIGFMAVDYLSDANEIRLNRKDFKAIWGKGIIQDREVILAKPQTFMNLSGEAVSSLANYFHIEPAHIITIYDDVDLELGCIRVRPKGSSGGHRGMESIIEKLGTGNFPRIRLGIGRPMERADRVGVKTATRLPISKIVADYVLSPFDSEEKDLLKQILDRVKDAVDVILKDGIERAMNRFNK